MYCDEQVFNNWSISIDSSVSYLQIFGDQLDMAWSTHNDQGFRQLTSHSILLYNYVSDISILRANIEI